MTDEVVVLRFQVEQLRKQLSQLIANKALTDPEVIRVSQELDEMLNRYQRLLQKTE